MNSTDRDAIDTLVESLVAAFNRHEARGFAAGFTESASFVDVLGRRMAGRQGIEAGHRFPFGGPLAEAVLTVEKRTDTVVHPDVAVVDLAWRTRGGRGGDGRAVGERVGLLSLTTVRSGSRWQIALGHNVDYTNAFDRTTDSPDRADASRTPGTPGEVVVTGSSETSS
ncbi:SgcJ/EcaC family oxidoreductase [Streptomyces bathyalis]|uniref:SgcJ/EcaC family oxidoreductase n=1 Tax=Streptomyces bathyalis TaxID=2710756 RepID=A0A7T1WW42_9ACTN|nr:SgcJ/EcaC family oxidoreductase [Streptomyces bathyalis]QPP09640.1 SgcJ/EcaC family oxidoreductase [Streptomyces bathyalis]